MNHYFVCPDAYGDPTIWRDVPDHDPVAILTWTPNEAELFDLAARDLERRPA